MKQTRPFLIRCRKQMARNKLFIRKTQLLSLFILFFIATLSAQQSKVWDYPIPYGKPEWEKLKTFNEKMSAYNVPDSLLKVMTTKDLVETCLNYPNFGLITLGKTDQQGYNLIKSLFNGFRELERRTDAAKELYNVYIKMNPRGITNINTSIERGAFSIKFTNIELIIAQKEILGKLNKDTKNNMMRRLIDNYDFKNNSKNFYTLKSLSPICLALGRIMNIDKPEIYQELKTTNPKLHDLIGEGEVSDTISFHQIINASKIYLNQLKQ